ncbi:MAG: PD40 domain-containing protein [Fidelibacterota bacterium]|nr:MAG: PD40 domain-containing protein [Candidatus Neomarinimicrobiota bacterium]
MISHLHSVNRIHWENIFRIGGIVWVFMLLLGPLHGQFYFGRNKIQYEQFDWQVLTTAHFQIFYYPVEETLAKAAAYWAEEAYGELEQKFNHTLARRIPLVIYSNHLHFQQTNTTSYLLPEGVGGFFEFVKGRVVLPNNGSMYDFRKVIRHELVHVFMYAKINTKAQQAGIWNYRHPPLWFTEGLAEWWSTGWDTEAEMVIRDALLHDHLLSLGSMSLASAGFLLYKEGQSFLQFLETEYGRDRIRQVMEEYYQHDTFEEALAAVTGVSYSELTRNWRLILKQVAAKTLAEQSLPGGKARPLTRLGANVAPAIYWDSAGKAHAIYLSSRDGYTNIYRQALEKPKEQVMIHGERSPEMESLHFLQSGLSVSSDGVLAFVAKSHEHDVIRLVNLHPLVEAGSRSIEPFLEFSHPDLITIRSPVWSHDGSRIVFSAQDRSGKTDIYLWSFPLGSSSSGEPEALRLTNDIYLDREPCFSPDGRAIIFSSDRGRPELDGATNLFLLDLADNQIRMVTFGPYQDQRPRWSSHDPGAIHFVSDRSGTPNIWRLALLSNAAHNSLLPSPLTDLHTGAVDVLPLPGDSLLITAFQDYSFQLHLMLSDLDSVRDQSGIVGATAAISSWSLPHHKGKVATDSRPYRLKYSLDIAQTAVAHDPIYGFLGGAQLGISDMLGDRYYHFLLANTAQVSSEFLSHMNLAVTAVNLTRRINRSWGIFRFANDYYWDPYQGIFFEQSLGIRAAMNYPLNVFRRVELSGSLWQSRKKFHGIKEGEEEALLLSNYFSVVHDNSLWQLTGPIDGWRMRITGGLTFNFARSQIHNYSALFDNRLYLRFTRRLTFAQRTMIWYNTGTDIRRFYIGGSWGLRGYGIYQVFGRKYFMLNQELRFPFARSLMLNLRSVALGMAPIRGALFLDVGKAWEEAWEADPRGVIGSYGFGFRGLFMGGLVLRLDIGRRTNFRSKDSPWFTQLFFGWDY